MPDASIYWFRDDLRLTDLPGLQAAASAGPVLPVFVLDPHLGDPWILGGPAAGGSITVLKHCRPR